MVRINKMDKKLINGIRIMNAISINDKNEYMELMKAYSDEETKEVFEKWQKIELPDILPQ